MLSYGNMSGQHPSAYALDIMTVDEYYREWGLCPDPPPHLSFFLTGVAACSISMSKFLGNVTDIPSETWLTLQEIYEHRTLEIGYM